MVDIKNENDLLSALADVTSPGFGNVGRKTYSIGRIEGMEKWDFADKLNLQWLLNNPQSRIKTNYSVRDFGGNVIEEYINEN